MTSEDFLRRFRKWEHAGFIHSDVWSNMDDIVDSDVRRSIETDASISTLVEFEKLTEDDIMTERVLICVSPYMVASRRLQFALEILRLEYYWIRTALYGVEMGSNFEVCHQCNVFYVFYLVILHNYIIVYIVVPKGKVLYSKVKRSCVGSKCKISFTHMFI